MKDRLREFQERSKAYNPDRRYTDCSDAGTSMSEDFPFFTDHDYKWDEMEEFLQQVRDVENQIVTLDHLLVQIRENHSIILKSPGVDPAITQRWNDLIDEFTLLSSRVNMKIKELNHLADQPEESPARARIRMNHVMILNRSIRDTVFRFNAERERYRDRCKGTMHKYLKISNIAMTEDEMDDAIDSGQIFSTKSMLMGDRSRRMLYDDVQNRHQDLKKLEASVAELHEMFQDVYMLVESQGDVLNNIETNVSNAAEYANQAQRNVLQARQAKQRNIKLKIALCVCICVTIFILILLSLGVFCLYVPFVCR